MNPQELTLTGIARRAAIIACASKKEGMRVPDLRHLNERACRRICNYFVRTGELHCLRRNSRLMLYFYHRADADAACQPGDTLVSNPRSEPHEQQRLRSVKKLRKDAAAASHPLPVGVVFGKNAQAVETERTIYTLCPAFKPRYVAVQLPFKFAVQYGRSSAGLHELPPAPG